MKTKTNILIAVLIAVLITAGITYAQDEKDKEILPAKILPIKENSTYQTAIGLRAGETSGLTLKQFFSTSGAFEGIVGLWNNGMSATFLLETYAPAFNVHGLNWYYGGGGHAAFETRYYYFEGRRYNHAGGIGLGLDGIIGIEYKILPIPFAISLDLKPYVEVNTDGRFYLGPDPGIGLKFAF